MFRATVSSNQRSEGPCWEAPSFLPPTGSPTRGPAPAPPTPHLESPYPPPSRSLPGPEPRTPRQDGRGPAGTWRVIPEQEALELHFLLPRPLVNALRSHGNGQTAVGLWRACAGFQGAELGVQAWQGRSAAGATPGGTGVGGGGVGPARRAQGARPAPAGVRTGLLVPRGGRGLQGASPKRARPPPLPPPESARSVPGLGRDGGALASLCWGDLPRGEARPGSARCGPRVLWPWSSQGGGAGEKNPPGYHSGLSLCPVPVPVPTKELGPQRQRLCIS